MRILFATAHPHLPQIAGGLQANTDETMRRLAARGHSVSLLCGLTKAGLVGLRHRIALKIGSEPAASDSGLGYRALRAWRPAAPEVVAAAARAERPDVVVAQGGEAGALVEAFGREGVPGVLYFHNVEFSALGAEPAELDPRTGFVSNSEFTRRRVREAFGVDSAVVLPLIEKERYAAPSTREAVVFVNPIPQKGSEIAFAVAERCPDIPFLFVESWTIDARARRALARRAARLPNVTLMRATDDMRAVYGRARLVLAPSLWEETFGRVVAEGHLCGAPAIASAVGGLPEATGPGGVLVDSGASIEDWVAALRALWDDPDRYADLARAAAAYAARPQLDPARQIAALEAILEERLASPSAPRRAAGGGRA